jgi:hypothetical protein
MRRTVRRLAGCLGRLSAGQRAVLVRRAGVGPLRPRSRYVVARRLDIRPSRVARLERSGMRRLQAFSRAGGCGAAATAVAPGHAPSFPGAPPSQHAADGAGASTARTHDASTRSAAARGDAGEARAGVKGEFESSDDAKPPVITPPGESDDGADLTFPILLLVGAFALGYAVTRELSSSGRAT